VVFPIEDRPPLFADSKGFDIPIGRLKRKQVEALYGVKIHVWPNETITL
jgi:hypothetical protein